MEPSDHLSEMSRDDEILTEGLILSDLILFSSRMDDEIEEDGIILECCISLSDFSEFCPEGILLELEESGHLRVRDLFSIDLEDHRELQKGVLYDFFYSCLIHSCLICDSSELREYLIDGLMSIYRKEPSPFFLKGFTHVFRIVERLTL